MNLESALSSCGEGGAQCTFSVGGREELDSGGEAGSVPREIAQTSRRPFSEGVLDSGGDRWVF